MVARRFPELYRLYFKVLSAHGLRGIFFLYETETTPTRSCSRPGRTLRAPNHEKCKYIYCTVGGDTLRDQVGCLRAATRVRDCAVVQLHTLAQCRRPGVPGDVGRKVGGVFGFLLLLYDRTRAEELVVFLPANVYPSLSKLQQHRCSRLHKPSPTAAAIPSTWDVGMSGC